MLGNTGIGGCVYHLPSCTNASQITMCHACFTRGCQKEHPIHGCNPGPKHLSECEEKDLSNFLVLMYCVEKEVMKNYIRMYSWLLKDILTQVLDMHG